MLGRQYFWSYGIPVVTARFFQQESFPRPLSPHIRMFLCLLHLRAYSLCISRLPVTFLAVQVAPGGPETLAVQDFSMQVALIEAGLQVMFLPDEFTRPAFLISILID